jgi:hypothetical protein
MSENNHGPGVAAWEVFWRLRAVLNYLEGALQIARAERERWPEMAGELEKAAELVIANKGIAQMSLPNQGRNSR